jgi:hypothetical protein
MIGKPLKRVFNRLQKLAFFIPFTWYFLAFTLIGLLTWRWLKDRELVAGTSYHDIFSLLLEVMLVFAGIMLAVALLSVFASWMLFYYNRKKQHVVFRIATDDTELAFSQERKVNIQLHPVLKPLFGFLKIRLQYGPDLFSGKFSLVEKGNKRLFASSVNGTYHWPLPEIREYHINRAIIYFEDLFQFFSLAISVHSSNRFFTQPDRKEIDLVTAFPRKTEDITTRIEEIRRVEGEHINYKHFENNDDVRRIVWKIYAKNKELVVRIPEIMDPYASHIYLYASFHTTFETHGNRALEKPFLNYYKSVIWTIYSQLAEQGLEVRFIPDQQTAPTHFLNGRQEVQYAISTAAWQRQRDLQSYCRPNEMAVLVVSSLSEAESVIQVAEQHGNEVIIILVRLSNSLDKHSIYNWVEWVFVQQEKDEMEMNKTSWRLSMARPRITENERRIQRELQQYEKPVII